MALMQTSVNEGGVITELPLFKVFSCCLFVIQKLMTFKN